MGRFSDESFRLCDIQFNCPQILVEAFSTSEEISNFDGTRRIGGSGSPPLVTPIEVQDPFQAGKMATSARDKQNECAALRIAFFHYCREISGSGDPPKNAVNLDMGRESLAQAASLSSAPIRTAVSASRLRAPLIFSSVAALRVTRLIAASAFRCSAPASGGERRRKTRSTGRLSIAL